MAIVGALDDGLTHGSRDLLGPVLGHVQRALAGVGDREQGDRRRVNRREVVRDRAVHLPVGDEAVDLVAGHRSLRRRRRARSATPPARRIRRAAAAGRRVPGEERRAGDGQDADRGDGHRDGADPCDGPRARAPGRGAGHQPRSGSSHRTKSALPRREWPFAEGYERATRAIGLDESTIVERPWHHRRRPGPTGRRVMNGTDGGSSCRIARRHRRWTDVPSNPDRRFPRRSTRVRSCSPSFEASARRCSSPATGSSWPATATSAGPGAASSRTRTSGSAGSGSSADPPGPAGSWSGRRATSSRPACSSRPGLVIERTSSSALASAQVARARRRAGPSGGVATPASAAPRGTSDGSAGPPRRGV